MNVKTSSGRSIRVDYLPRVEGEGAIRIQLKGRQVQDVQLNIFEPPRLFEGFLRGRHYTEVPDIVSRICGICPFAYQMSAVQALEQILGIAVHPAVRLLRRLFYCAEYIESHSLHVFMLHAPDFLGYPDAIAMARDHRQLVEQALRLKKTGNTLMAALGGREIHPISVAVGGFHKTPSKSGLAAFTSELQWARDAAIAAAKLFATFDFPDFEQDYECVALTHPDEYPLNEGRIVSNKGLDIAAAEYDDHFVEQQVRHSNALQSRLRERGSYLVGPIARFNLNYDRLPASARQAAADAGLVPPCRNPFRGIVVRAVELVFACEEALALIGNYEPPPTPKLDAPARPGTGHAATEAPRGVLYHRYEIDARGMVVSARIVPPTAQNQKRIEDDLWQFVPRLVDLPAEQIAAKCEQAVRNYDPCISCATHFVTVEVSGG
jgi:coenzyme F420-reducing hydrogenase alpha subunit